jgi:Mycothiol maleylpyruvate isomerase N-terminal domain
MAEGLGERHLAVCRRFGESVRAANGKWERPSPCDGWDARGVLEHVIGFHDVLLLRPLGLKPNRPHDDPHLRWELTYGALEKAFEPGRRLFERDVDVPVLQGNSATRLDASAVMPNLTRDVLCTPGTWPGRWTQMTGWTRGGASTSSQPCRATHWG